MSCINIRFIAAGVNVRLLGPLPTPGVAYLTRSLRNQFGLVISASHNNYLDNGIKLFDGNGEKILLRKRESYYVIDAGTSKVSDISKNKINLSGWKFPIIPREDWKQIFTDAWRMERDYFYDKNMHGVDWDAMHEKYFPLVDRVTTRNELSDLIGRFVGELSALHTSVRGGDLREDNKNISVASLGAVFSRDDKNKGFKIDYIYKALSLIHI